MAPIFPLPPPPPQVARIQTPPPATPSRFKDLNPSQARWLEVLEKHGILKTNPASSFFGPEQAVRRDELLMSEARLIELFSRRDQEQQAIIERLRSELAQLRSEYQSVAAATRNIPAPSTPQTLPKAPEPTMLADSAKQQQLPPKLTEKAVELVPVAVRTDKPVQVARLQRASQSAVEPAPGLQLRAAQKPLSEPIAQPRASGGWRDATAINPPQPPEIAIEEPAMLPLRPALQPVGSTLSARQASTGMGQQFIAVLRHRQRLGQFPKLQHFLSHNGSLDPTAPDFEEVLLSSLADAGVTPALLAEAARQASWFDAQLSM